MIFLKNILLYCFCQYGFSTSGSYTALDQSTATLSNNELLSLKEAWEIHVDFHSLKYCSCQKNFYDSKICLKP